MSWGLLYCTKIQQKGLISRFGLITKVKNCKECHGLVEERREICETTSLEVVKFKTFTASEKFAII